MRVSSNIGLGLGVLAALVCNTAFANEGSIQLPDNPDSNVTVIFHHVPGETAPSELLQVFVGNQGDCCTGKMPIAGRYIVNGHAVTFDPAFDFIAGQKYTVSALNSHKQDTLSTAVLSEFTIAQQSATQKPEIVAIYPSGDSIPENTLRFYVHFSTPMKPHMSSRFIKLLDANGTADTEAFMTFKQELWSEDRKRLTLLMDPGRIKRGVAQNRTLGPALLEGKNYSIVVEQGWQSASGSDSMPRFEKTFSISSALRTLPDTKLWTINTVRALTRDPLLITFDRTFDRHLAKSSIIVRDEHGQLIEGEISVTDSETSWKFLPVNQWTNKYFHIVVDPRLEDVAGNNLKELLDHPVGTETKSFENRKIILEQTPTAS